MENMWSKEEMTQEFHQRRHNSKLRDAARTPKELLAALRKSYSTEKRVTTWLEGMIFMIEVGEAETERHRLKLFKQTLGEEKHG